MEFRLKFSFFFLLTAFGFCKAGDAKEGLIYLEDLVETKLSDYSISVTKWLEDFNDRNIGRSVIGKALRYEDIKPKLDSESRSKKWSSMMPMVFHIGATSTWMLLTAVMATKSVAIGMILLIFKIAVSAAKVSSFFTMLKEKHNHHHDWSWTPPPHYEHHHDKTNHIEEWPGNQPAVLDWSPDYSKHGSPEWMPGV